MAKQVALLLAPRADAILGVPVERVAHLRRDLLVHLSAAPPDLDEAVRERPPLPRRAELERVLGDFVRGWVARHAGTVGA